MTSFASFKAVSIYSSETRVILRIISLRFLSVMLTNVQESKKDDSYILSNHQLDINRFLQIFYYLQNSTKFVKIVIFYPLYNWRSMEFTMRKYNVLCRTSGQGVLLAIADRTPFVLVK